MSGELAVEVRLHRDGCPTASAGREGERQSRRTQRDEEAGQLVAGGVRDGLDGDDAEVGMQRPLGVVVDVDADELDERRGEEASVCRALSSGPRQRALGVPSKLSALPKSSSTILPSLMAMRCRMRSTKLGKGCDGADGDCGTRP